MISDQMFEDIVSPAYFSSRLMEPLEIIKSIFRDQSTWGNTIQGGEQMAEFMHSEIFSDIYFRHLMGIFMCNVLHVRIEAVIEVDSSGTSTPSADLEFDTSVDPGSMKSEMKSVTPEIVAAVILSTLDCQERIEDIHTDLALLKISLTDDGSVAIVVPEMSVATAGLTPQSVSILGMSGAVIGGEEEKEVDAEEKQLKRKKIVKKKNYGAGLFYLYSKLNHSCACNTVNQGGSEAEVTLIATADIPKGTTRLKCIHL